MRFRVEKATGKWMPVTGEEPGFQRLSVKETVDGFVSTQFPPNYPFAKRHLKETVRGVGRKGAVIVSGKAEAQEIAKRASDAGEHVTYDY